MGVGVGKVKEDPGVQRWDMKGLAPCREGLAEEEVVGPQSDLGVSGSPFVEGTRRFTSRWGD